MGGVCHESMNDPGTSTYGGKADMAASPAVAAASAVAAAAAKAECTASAWNLCSAKCCYVLAAKVDEICGKLEAAGLKCKRILVTHGHNDGP